MDEQNPTDVSYGSDDLFELHVITGLRAMHGDGKARQAMEKVKGQSSGAFELAMAEAETRYHALSEEDRANPAKVLNQLVASSMRLKTKLAFGGGGLWSLVTSIPRALKRLIWK